MILEKDKIDYKKIGLSCGLEIHQQLDTRKLFCKCESTIINDKQKPDKIIKRKLFARTSETGEKDVSADVEQKKNKTFVYSFYNKCNCLIETDSQPPFNLNKEALDIATTVSLLTNCCFVDVGHVMRKQVIDGSNVSGFQRTLMVSTDGYLTYDFGKVRVNKILLEEDSARPIKRTDSEVFYSLDRQGIPLIELVVWHDIHTPEDVKKVAKDIGNLFRRTCKTKRGLGTIRQDINISIKKGARVEIKGTQDLDLIPVVVKREVIRQLSLIDVQQKLASNNTSYEQITPVDVSDVFKDTSCLVIKKALQNNKVIYGYRLPNLKGILGTYLQPNRRVGTEIASVLKSQTNVKGIIHLDELPNYGVVDKEITFVSKRLSLDANDSFVIVSCDKEDLLLITEILNKRLAQLFVGVPEETRIATVEGNTEYQRPLSSGARMYPETDHKPVVFTKELIDVAKKNLPRSVEERENIYSKKYNLNQQLISKMVLSNYAILFEEIVEKKNINATTVAVFLLEDLKNIQRDKLIKNVTKQDIRKFFLDKEFSKIPKSKVVDSFILFLKNDCDLSKVVSVLGLDNLKKIDVDSLVDEIIKENKDFVLKQKERSINFVVGQLMKKTKGLVNAKEALDVSKKKVSSFLEDL